MSEHEGDNEVYAELDVGNLCITNVALLKSSNEKTLDENVLKHVATLGARKLFCELLKLPSEYQEHVLVAKLPVPTTVIPREKPIPKEKPMTKWEKYAKSKGIKYRKREKKVWDESTKEWKPRYGYRSIKSQKDWLMEVPENADPNIDYFAKTKEEKLNRKAKNEYQRLRNIAAASKIKVTNMESVDQANKDQLARSLSAAKTATASVGLFVDKLRKEKAPKNKMKKRKFMPNNPSNLKAEKENSMKIFESMEKSAPLLNVEEAVQRHITRPLKASRTREQVENKAKRLKAKKNKFIKDKFRGKYSKGFRKR